MLKKKHRHWSIFSWVLSRRTDWQGRQLEVRVVQTIYGGRMFHVFSPIGSSVICCVRSKRPSRLTFSGLRKLHAPGTVR